jgi:hypothetical protein
MAAKASRRASEAAFLCMQPEGFLDMLVCQDIKLTSWRLQLRTHNR